MISATTVVAAATLFVGCGGAGTGDIATSDVATSRPVDCVEPTPGTAGPEPEGSAPPTDGPPADAGDGRVDVVVVGDSIIAENLEVIDSVLVDGGVSDVHYAALGARRIADTYDYLGERPSGLDAIDLCLDDGLTPAVWVIELGTNDVAAIAESDDPEATSLALIDVVLDELDEAEAISWVTVIDRERLEASRVFNGALRDRAGEAPSLGVIDWYAAAVDRPDWFVDDVHPNEVGAAAFAELVLAGIERVTPGV